MFEVLIQEAKLRNFSTKTIEVYLYYNQHFLDFCHKKPTEVTTQDIRHYLLYLQEKRYSSSSINLAHNALNFYYQTIMRRSFSVPFQQREQKMREILTQMEIKTLLEVTPNQKHKLLIALLYATGVRVAEVIKIKVNDFDFSRKLLLIRQGKGKKDRYTIISEKIASQIQEYLRGDNTQNEYLFATPTGHITDRTVQAVLKNARKKAKISKPVTPHVLRHSFATHLMEANVKTEFIQQLLGHRDLRTTRIYERITTKHLESIPSPYDSL
ncbi:site-specific integrase [Candidatus Woesearchaeota archaeon]|nr:site-specific integrase [Candidatus Woesearchaeota archaeon]